MTLDSLIFDLARVSCEEFYGDEPEPEPAPEPVQDTEAPDADLPF